MIYRHFIAEIKRSQGVAPQQEDPKAKTTAMRQKLRDIDAGLKDTVAQVTGAPIKNDQDFLKRGREVATAATGVKFGDTADPIDAALDKVRGAARYQAQQKLKADAAKKAAGDELNTATGDQKKAARLKKKEADQLAKDLEDGIDPADFDKLSTKQRMAISGAATGEVGRGTGTKEVDDALRDARVAAELPRMRDPIKVGGRDVYDRPYLRHGYQSSGAGMPVLKGKPPKDTDSEEFADYIDKTDEFLDFIGSANFDPDKASGDKTRAGLSDVSRTIDRGGIETDRVRTPSVRDNENITPQGERMGVEAGKAYLTPEVLKRQAALRKATDKMDSKGVQKLAFKHDVDDDLVNRFIDRYGQSGLGGTGKKKLLARIEKYGATAPEYSKYGGEDLFKGKEVPEKFLPKNPDGSIDRDAPKGVYDLKALKKADKELYAKAINNRARSIIKTYLKQGGVDAYAEHEGLRAITDMDLEHIASLRAEAKPGEESAGGYDHPDNFVLASGQLNKLRGAAPLGQRAAKYIEGNPTDQGIDKELQKKTYDDFVADLDDDLKDDLVDDLKTLQIGKRGLSQSAGAYTKRTQDDIDSDRKILRNKYGFSAKKAKALIPDLQFDQDSVVMGKKIPGEQERMVGKPYPTDPKQYAQDVRTNERDYLMYNAGLAELRKIPGYGKKLEDELLATPEGIQMLIDLSMMPASKMREKVKVTTTVDVDDDEIE